MTAYITLAIIGLAAGLLGGMLGVGGSVLMIPAMTVLFGPDQHLYQGVAMIVNFFVVLPAAIQHRRAGAMLMPVVRIMAPTAVAGVLVGVWLSNGPWFQGANEVYLSRAFGAFLFYVAGYNLYRTVRRTHAADITHEMAVEMSPLKTAGVVGLPMGVIGGLLGIGGGALAVPFQQLFLKMPLRRAIANSTAAIIALSIIGAVYKNTANARVGIAITQAAGLAACLAPTAVMGGLLGAKLTHIIPKQSLRLAFIALVAYGGYVLITRPA